MADDTTKVGPFTVTGGSAKLSIHTPLPVEHPFYALIGRVTSEWSHLEHALDQIIWGLSGISPHLGACITGQIMGATPRFLAIIALATAKGVDEAKIKKVRELMHRTFDVQEDRNRIIHDPWYLELQTGAAGQFKSMPKKDLRYGMADVEEHQVEQLEQRIIRRTNSVRALWNDLLS
jgi:hypothetical protein